MMFYDNQEVLIKEKPSFEALHFTSVRKGIYVGETDKFYIFNILKSGSKEPIYTETIHKANEYCGMVVFD